MTDQPSVRAPHRKRDRRSRGSAWSIVALAMGVIFSGNAPLDAAETSKATTSAAARADAAKSIPLDRIEEPHRAAVAKTVKGAGIFRRMPISVVDCDPDMYLFLVRNPEVIVNIWEVMNVTTVATERVKPGEYRASDGAGTSCNIQFVYSSPDTHVILADGAYSGPLFVRPVKAKCVIVLKSAYVKEADGRNYVTSRMDTFIDLDSASLELIAKTVQPLVGRAADHNFTETSAFIGTLSRAAEKNKPGVERLAGKLTKIDGGVRDNFIKLARAVPEFDASDNSEGETVVVSDANTSTTTPRTANATPVGRPITPSRTAPQAAGQTQQPRGTPIPAQPRRLR